jgi:saccharopine dehydrogenase-like NADP-dependent oxidoreductase
VKVLLVGVGGVGESIAIAAKDRPWLQKMVLADYNLQRAREVRQKLDSRKFVAAQVDATNRQEITALARKHDVDFVMNACDPSLVFSIFDAAYAAGCNYMDMAMSLSTPHPTDPYHQCGIKLGDYQFARASKWEKKGLLAILGLGMDPGVSQIFARYADKHLFDEIDEIGIFDGGDLQVQDYAFAPTFSIWTTIEECLNPPIIWQADKKWFTTEPFSEPEQFVFPEGIGPIECVNVEHEEVLMIPRWIKCKRVTFKYGLGREFIDILKTLQKLGLGNKDKIRVKRVQVAPRDVVAACLPDPAHLGDKMTGRACVGVRVSGRKDGRPRCVYIYQITDNQTAMQKHGAQAVVWQTAVGPVIAMELLATGLWNGKGVKSPEAFDPDPFVAKMGEYDFSWAIKEL